MPSKWIEFVKQWAKDNNTTYGYALSQPRCSQEYRNKYGVSKKPIKIKKNVTLEETKAPEDSDEIPEYFGAGLYGTISF